MLIVFGGWGGLVVFWGVGVKEGHGMWLGRPPGYHRVVGISFCSGGKMGV